MHFQFSIHNLFCIKKKSVLIKYNSKCSANDLEISITKAIIVLSLLSIMTEESIRGTNSSRGLKINLGMWMSDGNAFRKDN